MDARILAFREHFETLARGGVVSPRMATVFLTYGCNFHCAGCHYNVENRDGWIHLDADVLLRRLAELVAMGLRSVVFCGGGEPLWHRDIHRIVDGVLALGLRLGVISNGSRLVRDIELRDRLLSDAEFVRLSIYPETELAATRALAYLPRRAMLGIKLLIGADNVAFNIAAGKFLSEAPFDYLLYKPERESTNAIDLLASDEISAIADELRRELPRARGSLVKEAAPTRCYLTPVHVMIGAEGTLYLCCFFHGRKQRHSYGNLHDPRSMAELWNSEQHREARARVQPAECNRWDCRFFHYLSLADATRAGSPDHEASGSDWFDDDRSFI